MRVINHWDDIDIKNSRLDDEDKTINPKFCEGGIWQLMVAVLFMYSFVLMFRVAVVVASLLG